MPPKRKVETVEDNTEVPPAKKTSEEETPPISPDQGETGETAISVPLAETDMTNVLENIIMRSPAAGWNAWIGSLLRHLAEENRSKRSEKPDFLNLDKLEALKASGHVLNNLNDTMRELQGQEVFESYLKLLTETRDCFGHGIEYMVMQYINEHKGEAYYLNLCMSCYKEK